jgi:YHS domain-containing protein
MRMVPLVRVLLGAGALTAVVPAVGGCEGKVHPSSNPQPATNSQPTVAPHAPPEPPVAPSAAAKPAVLERVDATKVCMVNDHFMAAPQIPVAVEGKTYYGCCPMCERRLREQPDSRFGIDPVSKKRVDKAGAVIGKFESGKVLYFESEQTFQAYQKRT